MIVYLDKKKEKEELVFAQIICDRDLIRRKVDDLNYGTIVDKFILKTYISKGMLLSYCNYNESMFCNPKDILENLPTNSDRLMMLLDIMPFVKIKEINRIIYNRDDNYDDEFINLINWNTEILDMNKLINENQNNYDDENVQNILNNNSMFDEENTYRPIEVNNGKVKELKLTRENAEIGAKTLID